MVGRSEDGCDHFMFLIFFAFRRIPRYGPKIASRYGDELEPLPLSLKLWVTAPHVVFFLAGIVFFSIGLSIDY